MEVRKQLRDLCVRANLTLQSCGHDFTAIRYERLKGGVTFATIIPHFVVGLNNYRFRALKNMPYTRIKRANFPHTRHQYLFHDYTAFDAMEFRKENEFLIIKLATLTYCILRYSKLLFFYQNCQFNFSTTFSPIDIFFIGIAYNLNNVAIKEKYNCCQFEEQYVINLTLNMNTVLKGLRRHLLEI